MRRSGAGHYLDSRAIVPERGEIKRRLVATRSEMLGVSIRTRRATDETMRGLEADARP